MLGQFIARAIADHALPMDFLDKYKGKVDCEHARYGSCPVHRTGKLWVVHVKRSKALIRLHTRRIGIRMTQKKLV